jgi:hypothetical protein
MPRGNFAPIAQSRGANGIHYTDECPSAAFASHIFNDFA